MLSFAVLRSFRQAAFVWMFRLFSSASERVSTLGDTPSQLPWLVSQSLKPAHTPAAKQITKFLNEFEVSVRYKLSTLAERVGSLERHLEYCETAVKNKEQLQRLSLTSEPAPAGGR